MTRNHRNFRKSALSERVAQFGRPCRGLRTLTGLRPQEFVSHMTRRAFLSLIVLIIYNLAAGTFSPTRSLFLRRAKKWLLGTSQKIHEFPIDFDRSDFHKNSPRAIHVFFCRTSGLIFICRVIDVVRLRWRSNFFFGPIVRVDLSYAKYVPYLSVRPGFLLSDKTCSTSAVPLTRGAKRIVRLRCRCSCEMCSTSAAPLLAIFKTFIFLS